MQYSCTLQRWDGDSWETVVEDDFTLDANGFAASQPLHDAAGNLTCDGRRTFTYDAWNRLTEVRIDDGDGALGADDTLVATFTYDGLGRRVSKTVDNSADWDCTYHYYYDLAWRRIETRNGSNQVLKQYVYGTRYVDNPVQIGVNQAPTADPDFDPQDEDHDAAWYWPIQDANFNVVGLVDSAGDLVERYEYTPYGQRTVFKNAGSNDETTSAPLYESQRVEESGEPQAWSLCDLGHQGLFLDKELGGLYDNRFRVLHPRFGRWMQRDPMGYAYGMNVYEYVGSMPTAVVDPSGLKLVIMVHHKKHKIGVWQTKRKRSPLISPPREGRSL